MPVVFRWTSFEGEEQMRALTPEEMDIVAGGDGTTITVTGTRTDYFFLMRSLDNGGGGGGSSGGGGGGGAPGYTTPGVSAAANAFANQHVQNKGNTAADQKEYQKAHDDVAKLYDWAQSHPNDTVDIGNGETITGSQLAADLEKMTIEISDTGGGPTGGQTALHGDGTVTITINPQNSNVQTYNASSTGQDYVVFHEIGHELQDTSFAPLQGQTGEDQADAAARSMENKLGIPTYTPPH